MRAVASRLVNVPTAALGGRTWPRWGAAAVTLGVGAAAVLVAIFVLKAGLPTGFAFVALVLFGLLAPVRWLAILSTAGLFAVLVAWALLNRSPPQPAGCPESVHHESGLPAFGISFIGILATGGVALGAGVAKVVGLFEPTTNELPPS